jgi:hypothetical protein
MGFYCQSESNFVDNEVASGSFLVDFFYQIYSNRAIIGSLRTQHIQNCIATKD